MARKTRRLKRKTATENVARIVAEENLEGHVKIEPGVCDHHQARAFN
jgi:hypothetical protein